MTGERLIEQTLGVTEVASGVTALTQYGVQFPSGFIQWGDVSQGSRVKLVELNLPSVPYNSDSTFYLDPEFRHNGGPTVEVEALKKRWASAQERMHIDPLNQVALVFVKRELMIARGETRTS